MSIPAAFYSIIMFLTAGVFAYGITRQSPAPDVRGG
jgi:hypothetical protein